MPFERPVIRPKLEIIGAILGSLLVQEPPGVILVKVDDIPVQISVDPIIGPGGAYIVTV